MSMCDRCRACVPRDGLQCVEFHPNSNYVVTGSTDRTCRLWDVSNGDCVRVCQGHSEAVHCVAFSSDGNYLASGGTWQLLMGRL